MSVPTQEIIDLTDDPSSPRGSRMYPFSQFVSPPTPIRHNRPPRRVRDVISIDDMDDPVRMEPNNAESGSPEVEVLFARSRLPPARPRPPPTNPQVQRNSQIPRVGTPVVDLEADNVEYMAGENNIPDPRNRLPQSFHAAMPMAQDNIRREFARFRDLYRGTRQQLPHGHLFHRESDQVDDVMFMAAVPQLELPGNLDFIRQGFAMGPVQQPPPPPPTYDPPCPPRSGYSRSPKEDDILVCPNCEHELGVGDGDVRKQVWVAKKCGHVSVS
ncbi:hypothetical protein MMC07_002125 [Pseudocyphellaria aurata]|nr:hypothetical protein [Pseudocyphellaria aurata]